MGINWESIDKTDRELFPWRDELKASSIPIIHLPNFFNEKTFNTLVKRVKLLKMLSMKRSQVDNERFKRHLYENDTEILAIQNGMARKVSELFKTPLQVSYHFISMYHEGLGVCPVHTDRLECEFTVSVCVSQNDVWPLYVEGKQFGLNIGDALLYSGTHHIHWREQIPANTWCDMVLFFFTRREA